MFSQADAPFFHFGQNLNFPNLDQGFIEHLAKAFYRTTKRKLDIQAFWKAFESMDKVPQLARSLIERLALNPELTLEAAQKQLIDDVINNREFNEIWAACSHLDHWLLHAIAENKGGFYSQDSRQKMAKKIGVSNIGVPTIQSALRALKNKGLIGHNPETRGYYVDDPNFQHWLLHEH